MGCCKGSTVKYLLTKSDGTTQKLASLAEAHKLGKATGNTYTVKPVSA